jgi:hypothetical protein
MLLHAHTLSLGYKRCSGHIEIASTYVSQQHTLQSPYKKQSDSHVVLVVLVVLF